MAEKGKPAITRTIICTTQNLWRNMPANITSPGNECITQAHDSRAAIANYDKAIELNPSYTDAWIRKGITLCNNKDTTRQKYAWMKQYVSAPCYSKPYITVERTEWHLTISKGLLPISTVPYPLNPNMPKFMNFVRRALMRTGKEEEAALQWTVAERLREKKC